MQRDVPTCGPPHMQRDVPTCGPPHMQRDVPTCALSVTFDRSEAEREAAASILSFSQGSSRPRPPEECVCVRVYGLIHTCNKNVSNLSKDCPISQLKCAF